MRDLDSGRRLRKAGNSTLAFDLTPIVLIAGGLVAIQLLVPAAIRAELAFDHQEFVPWTLVTSAYVHPGTTQLLQNVGGFLGAAVVAYILCRDLGARQWFHMTTAVLILVLPILVSLTSYGIITWIVPQATPVEQGFSGVVSGFVGFIFAVFIVWVRERASPAVAQYVGQAVVVLIAGELALIYSGLDVLMVGLVGVGLALTGWGLSRERRTLQQWWRYARADVLIGSVVVSVLLVFVMVLFPADFVGAERTVNIFAHAAGLVWGAGCAFVVREVLR